MGNRYTVQPGDSLSGIAMEHGYPSWRIIYYHCSNAAFRRRRPNPNLIYPGDVLELPDVDTGRPTHAELQFPEEFANYFGFARRLRLNPVPKVDLFALGPVLQGAGNPSSNTQPLNAPATPKPAGGKQYPGVMMGGLVLDTPPIDLTTGEPVRGGYGVALRWAGKALLKAPFVRDPLDSLKNRAVDFAWKPAPTWLRGTELGLVLAGASVLLYLRPTREFIFDKVHGQDVPMDLLHMDWLSIQPRLGINGDWGGVIIFDLQNLVTPKAPARRR